jgi:hypothetical protein
MGALMYGKFACNRVIMTVWRTDLRGKTNSREQIEN